jgi:hypothetical protein
MHVKSWCNVVKYVPVKIKMVGTMITFLDIIHHLVFCLRCPVYISKHNVSETGFYLRPQVKPTQLGPIDITSPEMERQRVFYYLKPNIGFNMDIPFPNKFKCPTRPIVSQRRAARRGNRRRGLKGTEQGRLLYPSYRVL